MRFWMWVLIIIGIILFMKAQFPYALAAPGQQMNLIYMVLLFLLVAGSGGLTRSMRAPQAVRDAMIWLGLILALVLAYSYRDELRMSRLAGELIPSHVQVTGDGALSIATSSDGHFHLEAEVNGQPVDFLIDTGASDIVLSPHDAQAAGYATDTLNYTRTYSTANGIGTGAPVRIENLSIGPITLRDLPASVNSTEMDESLLGMAFLKQFHSFSVEGNTLTINP